MDLLEKIPHRVSALCSAVTSKIPAWALLCILAAVMLIAGGLRGEAGIQLAKAIRVCLECIGIG